MPAHPAASAAPSMVASMRPGPEGPGCYPAFFVGPQPEQSFNEAGAGRPRMPSGAGLYATWHDELQ